HYLFIRIAHMTCSIIASITIVYICKKNNKTLNLHVEPNYSAIKGTKDVLIQKITGLIYGTVPVLYMSIFLGSVYVSVYAVYNSIFTLVKNILYSLVNAPRMSFGALIAEKDTEYVKEQFLLYEFIIVFFSTIIFCSALVMIIPFILLYTRGITDIEYNDNRIAIMLTLIGFVEIIHIPSGHIINMSGNFSYSKKFQLVAAILLIVLIPIASHYWGFIGILVSIFCAAIALAIMEIAYIHNRYFHKTLGRINRIIFSNLLFSTLLSIIELHYINNIDSYYNFFIIGFIVLLANSFILLVVNYLINRKEVVQVLNLIKNRIL
ncbi:MAG: hypothetical protein RBQ66_08885, partial [Candidatus Cloacimonadaceae bacterium]|nr:hypothetical protein [Candidatus Cloacimonadaceae bacterium]